MLSQPQKLLKKKKKRKTERKKKRREATLGFTMEQRCTNAATLVCEESQQSSFNPPATPSQYEEKAPLFLQGPAVCSNKYHSKPVSCRGCDKNVTECHRDIKNAKRLGKVAVKSLLGITNTL